MAAGAEVDCEFGREVIGETGVTGACMFATGLEGIEAVSKDSGTGD